MSKVSKRSVRYRLGSARKHCGNCSMFRRKFFLFGSCTLVKGLITSGDVCDRWKAK